MYLKRTDTQAKSSPFNFTTDSLIRTRAMTIEISRSWSSIWHNTKISPNIINAETYVLTNYVLLLAMADSEFADSDVNYANVRYMRLS